MGKIKFRAKRVDNKEWVYGFYYEHSKPLQCFNTENQNQIEGVYIIQTAFADWGMPRGIHFIEVIPETVGQYSFLQDQKNEELYEGDIVSGCLYTMDEEIIKVAVITLKDGAFYPRDCDGNCVVYDHDGCVRIGNIFDNPELLKDKEPIQDV